MIHLRFPLGWRWSLRTASEAATLGLTPADLQGHVDYWTLRRFAVPVDDLDGDGLDAELRRSFDGILRRKRKAQSTPPLAVSAARDPYAWAPTQEHRAYCDANSHPIAPAVSAYRATGRPDKLGTLRANEDFMRRLKHWTTHGEFIADGPLPVPRAAKGAA